VAIRGQRNKKVLDLQANQDQKYDDFDDSEKFMKTRTARRKQRRKKLAKMMTFKVLRAMDS